MLKSNSLFYDKEISIDELLKDENVFTNKEKNRLQADLTAENISLKLSLRNQCEKGLFCQSFPSANSNEDLIYNVKCFDFIGKKRKPSDDSLDGSDKEEANFTEGNSGKKSFNALAGNENAMWLSKNKNFKFVTTKKSEPNTESPMKILNRDRLSNANPKKANLISFTGESKITDFFKEKKKNYNSINKQIGLSPNEIKDGALNAECFSGLKNYQSQMKSCLPSKPSEKKPIALENEKLKKINLASPNKMHNKNIIELYNLNQKTIMEENDIEKLPMIAENPDSESTCDLLHDKLIFSGENNFKNKINYFNFEGIKNNNYNQENSIINFNNNDLSALNQILNNEEILSEQKRKENSEFNGSEENQIRFDAALKSLKPIEDSSEVNCRLWFKGEICFNNAIEAENVQSLKENLDLNESQDYNYNNILERRENKNYDLPLLTNKQAETPYAYASDLKEKTNENNSVSILENTFSNLLLKDSQNAKTPLKKEKILECKNIISSPFNANNIFTNLVDKKPKLDSSLLKEGYEVNYPDSSESNENPNRAQKHNYFLRSQFKNSEAKENLNRGENKRKIRFSLSKKKVMTRKNEKKRRTVINTNENKVISNYFKQEKIKDKHEADKEAIETPNQRKPSDAFDINMNGNFRQKPQIHNSNNTGLNSPFQQKEKSSTQKVLFSNSNLNWNKNNLINKKMTATSTLKDLDNNIFGHNGSFGNFNVENPLRADVKKDSFAKKLNFNENERGKNKIQSKDYFFGNKQQTEKNLDLNSDIIDNEEEKIAPKFKLSAKTLDILRALEFKKVSRTQDNSQVSKGKDWRNVLNSINNKFKLNFAEEKPLNYYEEMDIPDIIPNKKPNESIIFDEDGFANNFILYKKDVFKFYDALSTEETFVLTKSPIFSCTPFPDSDEFDFENYNYSNNETNIAINHMDISDSEQQINKDNKENATKPSKDANKINTPSKKTKNWIKSDNNNKENKPREPNETNFKVKSKGENVIEEIKQILSSTSMKEKYEGLLNRELILPYTYKSLLKKFEGLDTAITEIKRSKMITSLVNIQTSLKAKNIAFNIEDFQKILYVVPHFYIYKWEKLQINTKNAQAELIIDIPNNIAQRIKEKYEEKTNFSQLQTYPFNPYPYAELPQEIINQRLLTFKKVLLLITSEEHKKFITENQIKTNLNPFKHKTWHHKFDLSKCKEIPMFLLINQLTTQRRR